MSSAMDGFKTRRKELEDIVGHVIKPREKFSKSPKKTKKEKVKKILMPFHV
jgi:hypothetical protein